MAALALVLENIETKLGSELSEWEDESDEENKEREVVKQKLV